MATEKLGESILKSRLGALTKDFEGVKKLLDELTDAAGGFGTTLSQSIRTAKGELHGLESALKGLESTLKRTSTTGSAIGAANISASLGQLTGQGRTYGGGYGGGGGGGGGGVSGQGFGRQAEGLFAKVGTGINEIGRSLPFPLNVPYKIATAGMLAQGGMAWGAMKQGHSVRNQWEQAARYTRGLHGPGMKGSRDLGFRGLSALGLDAFEGAGTLGMIQSQLGYARPKDSYDIRNIRALAQATGITPEGFMPTWEQARAGGIRLPESFALSNKLWGQARGIAAEEVGPRPTTARGRWARRKESRAYEEKIKPRAEYNLRQFMPGVMALMRQQIAGTGAINAAQQEKMQNLVASLASGPGGMEPEVASRMAAALGMTSAVPGGGEAGQLLMMRAAGFGNPMLAEYRKTAKGMGIDPSMFQRRNFLEAGMFLENDPARRVQAMMVAIGAEYGAERGTGFKNASILALEHMGKEQGMTKTLAKKLINAGPGAFSDEKLQATLAESGVTFDARGQIQGQIKPDVGGPLTTAQQAEFQKQLIALGPTVAVFADAVTKFNIGALQSIVTQMSRLNDELSGVAVNQVAMDAFFTPLQLFVTAVEEAIHRL